MSAVNGNSKLFTVSLISTSRSTFLKGAVCLFATAWCTALCPVYQYLKDSGIGTEGSLVTSVEIGDKSSVPPGTGRLFKFGSIPGIITCTKMVNITHSARFLSGTS